MTYSSYSTQSSAVSQASPAQDPYSFHKTLRIFWSKNSHSKVRCSEKCSFRSEIQEKFNRTHWDVA